MALFIDIVAPGSVTVLGAYVRIESARISGKDSMQYTARAYVASSEAVPFMSLEKACAYDLDGPNPIAQAYIHLKSMPEFAGATDC